MSALADRLLSTVLSPGDHDDAEVLARVRDIADGCSTTDAEDLDLLFQIALTDMLDAAWAGHWQPSDLLSSWRVELGERHLPSFAAAICRVTSAGFSGLDVPDEWVVQLESAASVAGLGTWPSAPAGRSWLAAAFCGPGEARQSWWPRVVMALRFVAGVAPLWRTGPVPSEWPQSLPGQRARHRAGGHRRSAGDQSGDQSGDRSGSRGGGRRPPAGGIDQKVLAKVRALLAKAESTTFPDEAESLSAKAQELMARYAIDRALVEATDRSAAPLSRRLWIENPYADAKTYLLDGVGQANRCRVICAPKIGCATLVGYSTDLDIVELLFTSLLVQGSAAVVAAGSQIDRYGRSSTRSFRQSFWVAYGLRIGERLREASEASVSEAAAEHSDLLPILASRNVAVDEAVDELFPNLVSRSTNVSNHAGWVAGRVAADQADLSAGEPLRATG